MEARPPKVPQETVAQTLALASAMQETGQLKNGKRIPVVLCHTYYRLSCGERIVSHFGRSTGH